MFCPLRFSKSTCGEGRAQATRRPAGGPPSPSACRSPRLTEHIDVRHFQLHHRRQARLRAAAARVFTPNYAPTAASSSAAPAQPRRAVAPPPLAVFARLSAPRGAEPAAGRPARHAAGNIFGHVRDKLRIQHVHGAHVPVPRLELLHLKERATQAGVGPG